MKRLRYAPMTAVFVLCLVGTFWHDGWAGEGAPENTNCNAEITWEVAMEAKLTQFDCEIGKHDGQPSLIFNVGLMNTTDKPLRYRINIFLEDMDKAAGHLVPRTGKPPVLEPGKSETVKIPFIGTGNESKKILVLVKPIDS